MCSTIVAEEDILIEEVEAITIEIASVSNEDVVFPGNSQIVRFRDRSSKCFKGIGSR